MNGDAPAFTSAVRAYWGRQADQAARQLETGTEDTGRRGEVTGGQHLDGFLDKLESSLTDAGVPSAWIHRHRLLAVLPGYFRATKNWDSS